MAQIDVVSDAYTTFRIVALGTNQSCHFRSMRYIVNKGIPGRRGGKIRRRMNVRKAHLRIIVYEIEAQQRIKTEKQVGMSMINTRIDVDQVDASASVS